MNDLDAGPDALASLERNRKKTFLLTPLLMRAALSLVWWAVGKLVVAAAERAEARVWERIKTITLGDLVELWNRKKAEGPSSAPPEVTLTPGATMSHDALHEELSREVAHAVSTTSLDSGKFGAGFDLAAIPFELALPYAQMAVKNGLDLAAVKFGPALNAVADATRDEVRQWVSDTAVETVRSFLLRFETPRPA